MTRRSEAPMARFLPEEVPRSRPGQRRVCQRCGRNRSLYRFKGRWRARQDHDLCQRCFRSLMDQLKAQWLRGER
jgi:hypothetical protein